MKQPSLIGLLLLSALAARSHYIYGVGYHEAGSIAEACREHLTAMETMESRTAIGSGNLRTRKRPEGLFPWGTVASVFGL